MKYYIGICKIMQVSYWCLYIWFLTYMLLKIRSRTCIIPRLGVILTRHARHLGGGVWEGRTTPLPLWPHNWKFTPTSIFQNPPFCTNLQLKMKKKTRGHAPRPHLTRVSHSLNDKYHFKQYLTGDPINLFRKYPSNPNSTPPPPLQKILGTGLLYDLILFK